MLSGLNDTSRNNLFKSIVQIFIECELSKKVRWFNAHLMLDVDQVTRFSGLKGADYLILRF